MRMDMAVGIPRGQRMQARAQDEELPALVAQYAQAERDARRAAASLERLIARCRPVAEQIARAYVLQSADVADIVQEALILLTYRLPQLRDPQAFPRWFSMVVHNACRQWLRRERQHRGVRPLALDTPVPDSLAGLLAPLDAPDPGADAAFSRVETGDALARLLRTLPVQQRRALVLAQVECRSHDQVGRELGVSPRAVEGLVYRALRRAQATAAQCDGEPRSLGVWCRLCGERRMTASLRLGASPGHPFELRVQCPACTPRGQYLSRSTIPFDRYPSLDEANLLSMELGGRQAHQWAARSLAGTPPRCFHCAEPLVNERHWRTAPGPAGFPLYMLAWYCPNCGDPLSPVYVHLSATAAARLPEWAALWRSAPRLRLEAERLVKQAGEERIVSTIRDCDRGRRFTFTVDCESLEVRSLEETGP